MEKDTSLWKKRKIESKIHWPLRDFRKGWTSSVSFGTPLLELDKLHDVFHVSMLRIYCSEKSHILPVQDIQVQEDFILMKSRKLF